MIEEKIVIEDEVRSLFMAFVLENIQCPVMELLSDLALQEDMHNRRKYQIIMCFESWLHLDSSEILKQNLHKINVIDMCFDILAEPDSCNVEASEALIKVMQLCKEANKYRDLYSLMLQRLITSHDRVLSFDEQHFVEEVRCYLDVYEEFIINTMDDFLSNPENQIIKTILYNTMLQLYKSKNYVTASRVIGVFISIMRKLEDLDDVIPSEEVVRSRKNFLTVHSRLLADLVIMSCFQAAYSVKQMKYYQTHSFFDDPEDFDHEDRLKIRSDIKDLLRRIAENTSFLQAMAPVAVRLVKTTEDLKVNPTEKSFCKLEGELFCAYALLRVANNNETLTVDTISDLLKIVLNIRQPVHALTFICAKIIGEVSPFIHSKPQILKESFVLLSQWVTDPKFEETASHSFYRLCKDNRQYIAENFDQFMDCKLM